MKFWSEFKHFQSRKCTWKCRLHPFCLGFNVLSTGPVHICFVSKLFCCGIIQEIVLFVFFFHKAQGKRSTFLFKQVYIFKILPVFTSLIPFNTVISVMPSWHRDTLHITGLLWGNPPIKLVTGHPLQSTSNAKRWILLLLAWTSCWGSRIVGNLEWHDALAPWL